MKVRCCSSFIFGCADGKLKLSGYVAIHSYVASIVACVLLYFIFAQTVKIQKPSVSYRNFFYVRGYVFVLTGNCYEKTIDQRNCACVK